MQFPLVMMKTPSHYLGQNLLLEAEKGHLQILSPPMMLLNTIKGKVLQQKGAGAGAGEGAEAGGGAPVP